MRLTGLRVCSIARSIVSERLIGIRKVAVHQHQLPHARPDGHTIIVLGCSGLRQAVVQLLEHIVLNTM